MKKKYKASYDEDGDVFTVYSENAMVKESIEVTDEIVLDIDKNNRLVSLELMDAYAFLNTLNKSISKKMLEGIKEVELEIKNYRNYWIITLIFKHDDKVIAEKLPAFSDANFESPLIASVKA